MQVKLGATTVLDPESYSNRKVRLALSIPPRPPNDSSHTGLSEPLQVKAWKPVAPSNPDSPKSARKPPTVAGPASHELRSGGMSAAATRPRARKTACVSFAFEVTCSAQDRVTIDAMVAAEIAVNAQTMRTPVRFKLELRRDCIFLKPCSCWRQHSKSVSASSVGFSACNLPLRTHAEAAASVARTSQKQNAPNMMHLRCARGDCRPLPGSGRSRITARAGSGYLTGSTQPGRKPRANSSRTRASDVGSPISASISPTQPQQSPLQSTDRGSST